MSNKASDQLYKLIKSLSKPEKRYFKVFSSRHVIGDQNNYQILFDAIDKQSSYDEDKLMRKFKDEAFVHRFSIAKSRLYNSILKSLDAFHANSSIDAQLKRQIHCAEILYKKSLYSQSMKLLNSAMKVASKHERHTSMIEIRQWQRLITEKENYEGLSAEELKGRAVSDFNLVEQLRANTTLWHAKSQLFKTLYLRGKVRSKDELKAMQSIMADLEKSSFTVELSTRNKYLYNHVKSAYFYAVDNYPESLKYLIDNLELIERSPQQFHEEPNIFLSVITNAIYLSTQLGKEKEAFDLLERLKSIPEDLQFQNNLDLEIRLFAIAKSTELSIYTQNQEYEKGLALIPEIEEKLALYDNKLSSVRKAFFYFNIAKLYFATGEHNTALKWINQLLNNIEIDKTQDIHCMGQMLNLIIHLELGNKSLLPYCLRSTKRYLETRNKVYQFESVFLELINETLKKRHDQSMDDYYASFVKSLEKLFKDPFERSVLEYFDFLEWAKAKATKG